MIYNNIEYPLIVNPHYGAYPPYHTGDYLEEYFFKYQVNNKINTKRVFIPVSWTTLNMMGRTSEIQTVLNTLHAENYYYLVAFGDECLKYLTLPKNTKVYHADGLYNGPDLVKIPVSCSRIPNAKQKTWNQKTVLASFIGSNTQECRVELMNYIKGDSRLYGSMKNWSIHITQSEYNLYKTVSENSKFVLCPRGNCPTSYRIYESMQLSAIPIDYSNESPNLPMQDKVDWNKLCLFANRNNIKNIIDQADAMTKEEWEDRVEYGRKCYEEYFNQEAVCKYIQQDLEKEI